MRPRSRIRPTPRRARTTLALPLLAWLLGATARAEVVILVPENQATIAAAIAAVPNGGTIDVAGGTYAAPSPNGFVLNNLGKGFTMRARAGATVVLSGSNARPVLRLQNTSPGAGGAIVFEGLTFADGRSTTNGIAGGVTLSRAHATFVDCDFENNESAASSTGGGGAAVFEDSRVTFLRARFVGNRAKNEGAGLKVGGGASGEPVVYVHASQFVDNLANIANHRNTAAGGGIHLTDGKIRVTNTRFAGNEAGYVGGGFYALGTWATPVGTPHADAVLADCTFEDNHARPHATVTPPAPTEAGAVHAEDQATVRIYNSRFLLNSAEAGGAVNLYRAIVEVRDSVFRGNRAGAVDGTGNFGGALDVLSNEGVGNARRSGSLLLSGSLVQGRYGAVTTTAKAGGCLHVAGDFTNRLNGATAASTRASVTISDTVFYDCDVSATSLASGGAFDIYLADVTMTDVAILGSDALGTSSTGGAGRITSDSVADLLRLTVAGNSAVFIGGGLYIEGTDLTLADSWFFRNEISPGVNEGESVSNGAALFTNPDPALLGGGQTVNMVGEVSGTLFSENVGIPVYDGDRNTPPINDLRYNSNTFYNNTFGDHVYSDSLACCMNTAALNTVVITRTGAGSTAKSQVDNTALGSAPPVGALLAVPPRILQAVAAGDGDAQTESFAAFAWSGGAATFDGGPVAGNRGLLSVGTGIHTLSVAGGAAEATDDVANGAAPAATLAASPDSIAAGGNATLQWSTPSGTFLAAGLDQKVGVELASGGSTLVSPPATTTYRLIVVTQEGGDDAEATVSVDEPSAGAIFADDFESGGTCRWDTGCRVL